MTPSTVDRRSRKSSARREALLDHADALIDERGLDGLTMTALAEVADYAPASLYTYFPSRSALLASLQQRALGVLGAVAADHAAAGRRLPGITHVLRLACPPVRHGLKLLAFHDGVTLCLGSAVRLSQSADGGTTRGNTARDRVRARSSP